MERAWLGKSLTKRAAIASGSPVSDGPPGTTAINDAAFLTRYLDDWRFLLQKIGTSQAMLHIEPDFWAYVRNVNSNPHAVPAKCDLWVLVIGILPVVLLHCPKGAW